MIQVNFDEYMHTHINTHIRVLISTKLRDHVLYVITY